MKFCPQCGTRLPEGARFCAGCGRAVEALRAGIEAPRAATRQSTATRTQARASDVAPEPRGWREQLPGLAVLVLFLAVGLGLWVTILRPGAPTSSAPSRGGPPPQAAAGGGQMPAGHPPTTLPDEAKKFVASMVDKANAAPNDVDAWKAVAQVQARAAEIDPSYAAAALESYKHVLALAPDDDDAIRGLGNVYYDQQQFPQASEQYEAYVKKHPDDPSVKTDLATTYLYQRQFDRAVALYHAVLEKNPDFMQAHFNLGLALEAMGKHDEALAALAKARELAPDDQTRSQIDRVTAQLKGESPPRLAAGDQGMTAGAGTAPGGGGAAAGGPGGGAGGTAPPVAGGPGAGGGAPKSQAPPATDFKSAVENGLRAHPILGPKITAIDWPEPTHARVTVANFPMQGMPEFARNLFKARLETILDDAKTRFATSGETSIELVDAATGASMEKVTH